MAVHRFVDRVVEDLPDEVMEAGRADAADVHAGPAPDGLEPFENGNVFGGIGGHRSDRIVQVSSRADTGTTEKKHGENKQAVSCGLL